MANLDRTPGRPPLKSADVYRPRLGGQREPQSKTSMSELRAWRELSEHPAPPLQPEQKP